MVETTTIHLDLPIAHAALQLRRQSEILIARAEQIESEAREWQAAFEVSEDG